MSYDSYDSRSNGPCFCAICQEVEIDDDLVLQGLLTCSDCEVLRPGDCFAYYAQFPPEVTLTEPSMPYDRLTRIAYDEVMKTPKDTQRYEADYELLKLVAESDHGPMFLRLMRNLILGLKIEGETGEFPQQLDDWECLLANILYLYAKENSPDIEQWEGSQ